MAEKKKIFDSSKPPTILPGGYGIGKIDGDMLILNFYDIGANEKIITSLAMPRKNALEMAEAIKTAANKK